MQNFFDTHLSEGLKMVRLFDFVDDLVFLLKVESKGFSYEYINQSVKQVLLFDHSAIGKTLQEVADKPEEVEVLHSHFQQVADTKEPVKFVYHLLNPTRLLIGDTTLYPIFDENGSCSYILTIVKDITEKYQLEQMLRENEEKYRLITENSLDVIKLINTDGIIEYVSPSSEVIVGFLPDTYIGKHFKDFLGQEERETIVQNFESIIKEQKAITVEVKYLHRDGHHVWMEIVATPVIKDGQVTQVVTSARNISERIEYREKLAKMAFHDYLSGLPNRRLFEDRLNMALRQAERKDKKVGLLLIDGKNFKRINDTFGHDIGDEVIKKLARRLERSVRQVDTVARFGEDEFAIVLPDIEKEEDAIVVAERIMEEFKNPWEYDGHTIHFNVDIGLALYPDHTRDQKELIRFADEAMYTTKADNKSTFYVYEPAVIL
ncbi:diguanylate cyclase domain-containing protein [Chryseomicrobium palamuruense]|uniref:Diguanylate cyclase domain-containing protein n=1 Tax=Chryseomicrobium palamuruense TaxID=682973 RepID=A0ABV8UY88_9BACL